MKILILITTLLLFVYSRCVSQDIQYARKVIATLCSDSMKGRGYVQQGDRSAADFIAEEFQRAGLKKYTKTYFQHFSTPVNSFPGKMSLSINGTSLIPGKDFLVEAGSPGIKGKYGVELVAINDLLDMKVMSQKLKSVSSKFIVIPAFNSSEYSADQLKQINQAISFLQYGENPAKGTIVLTTTKLTWSGSTEVFPRPSFTINSTAVGGSIETVEVNVENKFLKSHESQNIVGYIEGDKKDSLLVFSAHYDHLGMMGSETIFPGANDNASGVALLLNLVKHYAATKPKYTMIFICFAGEEIGLIGSSYFTNHPLFPLSKIKFLLNFDIAGTGDDGIQIVNGKVYQQKFDLITKINSENQWLKQIKIRGEACNSDHCLFHQKGVPCFFIYTLGGIQAYHDIYDRAETLPLTEYEHYFKLLVTFVKSLH